MNGEEARGLEAGTRQEVSAGDCRGQARCHEIREFERWARLAVHAGRATLTVDGETVSGVAELLLPAEGAPVVAMRTGHQLTGSFASDLRIVGDVDGSPFQAHSPVCFTRKAMTGANEGWSLVSPINAPVRIDYGEHRPAKQARVVLNNFDYVLGDAVTSETGFTREGTPFRVQLVDRSAEFQRRTDYEEVHPLLQAGVLRSASLSECSFEVLNDTDDDLLGLALDVAALCTFARGASVGVAMLECIDSDGRVARRIVPQPVSSRYRDVTVVDDVDLPRLFADSFATHIATRRAALPWRKLPSYCGSLEDMPYLEQKFASLMAAVEFFIRTSLIEGGLAEEPATRLDFAGLVGAARKRLGWEVPKHYNSGELTRLLRNAVVHGSETPTKDDAEFRRVFDKWRLFLFRRVLIRLGYQGNVVSPFKGVLGSSAVSDFSEAHNSFDPKEVDSHPLVQFVKYLKEHSRTEGEPDASAE